MHILTGPKAIAYGVMRELIKHTKNALEMPTDYFEISHR